MRISNPTGRLQRMSAVMLLSATALSLAACSDDAADPSTQIGPNPTLPEPQQYLIPPMNLAKVVGWTKDETPTVPQGLQIHAMASDLSHPRSLYTLPNGDVLVIESQGPGTEPIKRPKDLIMGFLQSLSSSGTGEKKPTNQITLLRDADGDGVPETRTVFLDHLARPSASPWSAMISTSPTPMRSSVTPTRRERPR
jgi:glucose/arabinose dehydrogenase